jgi:hypothetical protein
MTESKERIIPIIAICVLLIGSFTSIYVYALNSNNNANNDFITINDEEYLLEYLFSSIIIRNLDSVNASGIALDNIITSINVDCPSCNSYKIIGKDGYSQTVTWENMQNGVLTSELKVVFSDLPKAFNVKDVVEIEVIYNG